VPRAHSQDVNSWPKGKDPMGRPGGRLSPPTDLEAWTIVILLGAGGLWILFALLGFLFTHLNPILAMVPGAFLVGWFARFVLPDPWPSTLVLAGWVCAGVIALFYFPLHAILSGTTHRGAKVTVPTPHRAAVPVTAPPGTFIRGESTTGLSPFSATGLAAAILINANGIYSSEGASWRETSVSCVKTAARYVFICTEHYNDGTHETDLMQVSADGASWLRLKILRNAN
jgi:hypothetical protein